MDKESLKNEVVAAANAVWRERRVTVLYALGVKSVTRDEVVEGMMNSGDVARKLSPEAAAHFRALPPLIRRALLTIAFPSETLN